MLALVVVGLVVVGGGAFGAVLLFGGDEDGPVLLEPIAQPGPDPFTDPVAPEPDGYMTAFAQHGAPQPDDEAVAASLSDPAEALEVRDGHLAIDGSTPGLFGGTNEQGACDAEQLAWFLADHPDRAEAWADVQDIAPAEIPAYLAELTPVNVGADTRVLNHGFADGEATPREAVLQRGTAVLVDDAGVPRANCECGNPLLEPALEAEEEYDGVAWDGFTEDEVLVVEASPTPVASFELTNVVDGTRFERPVGTSGDADRPSGPQLEAQPEEEPEEPEEPEEIEEPEESEEPEERDEPEEPAEPEGGDGRFAAHEYCGTVEGDIGHLGDADVTSEGFDVHLQGAETCEIAHEVAEAFLLDLAEELFSPDASFPHEPAILGWECTSGPFLVEGADPEEFFGCRLHNAEIALAEPGS